MRWVDRPFLTILLSGLFVHGAGLSYLHFGSGGLAGHAFRSPDAREYYALARHIAMHGVFSQSDAPPFRPDTWRTPGYPLFLAAGMTFFGDSPSGLVISQHVLALINALIFFAIARAFMRAPRALFASLVLLLEPYHLLYAGWLLSTTLQVTILLLTWGTWHAGLQSRSWGWFILSGWLVGFLILIWPGHLILLGLLLIGIWLARWSVNRSSRYSAAPRMPVFAPLSLFLAAASIVFPWCQRNYLLSGQLALSDQSGVVLAYFKAAEVILWRQGGSKDRYLALSTDPAHAEFPHATWEAIDRELRLRLGDLDASMLNDIHWSRLAQGNHTRIDSFRISRELRDIAFRHLMASPVATVSCYATRILDQLTFPLSLAVAPPAGVATRRSKSMALAAPYVLLSIGFLARMIRGRFAWSDVVFPVIITAAVLVTAAPQVDPRFRVLLVPFLVFVVFLPRKTGATTQPRTVPHSDGVPPL